MGAFGENDSKDEAIEKWNKRVNVPLYGEVEGDWHTGTPTEEGIYAIKQRIGRYTTAEFHGSSFAWVGTDSKVYYTDPLQTIKWMLIEPYKETD